jgi:hypothetical protein
MLRRALEENQYGDDRQKAEADKKYDVGNPLIDLRVAVRAHRRIGKNTGEKEEDDHETETFVNSRFSCKLCNFDVAEQDKTDAQEVGSCREDMFCNVFSVTVFWHGRQPFNPD